MTNLKPLSASGCRLCGVQTPMRQIGTIVGEYPLGECPACGTLHTERRPHPMELKAMYDQLFTQGEYVSHRAEHEALKAGRRPPNFTRRRLLRRIEGLVSQRDLVEVGGGTGLFGVEARGRGWRYCNYDISEAAVAFCRELGLDSYNFPPAAPPPIPPSSADVVAMWEVLEHVWEVREYLEAVRIALRPGGLLVMSTPNYLTPALRDPKKWGMLASPPVHLNFFTPPSLERVLRAAGYSSVSVVRKRLYRPSGGLRGVTRSFRFLLGLDEPKTLHAIARKT